jgi:BASS family bile acid:Na+ symporter
MDPLATANSVLATVVFALVFAIGLRTRLEDLAAIFRMPGEAARSIIAMFVLVPALAILIAWLSGMAVAAGITLIAYAVAPLPALLANDQARLGAEAPYALGLGVLGALGAIVMTPLVMGLVAAANPIRAEVDTDGLAITLATGVALPLALGMLVGRLAPALADRMDDAIERIGGPILMAAIVAIVFFTRDIILDALNPLVAVGVLLLMGGGLAIGHVMGGPAPAHRAALALAASSRNTGFAISVASAAMPGDVRTIVGTALIYSLTRRVVVPLYCRWFAAGEGSGPAGGGRRSLTPEG